MDLSEVRIFAGDGCPGLAEKIGEYTLTHANITPSPINLKRFNNDEAWVKLEDNVRGTHTFIIQSTVTDAHWIQLFTMLDAIMRASAKEITAVIPYFGYSRQERKKEGRVPISAALMAKLIQTAGAYRIVSLELHSGSIQGFFNGPFDHLYAYPIWVRVIEKLLEERKDTPLALVSTDINSGKFVRSYKMRFFPDSSVVIIDKERLAHGESKIVDIYGDSPSGCFCVILDDMIDGGGSTINAADAVLEMGALEVHAIATHPVFSGNAIKKLEKSKIASIHVSDTIPVNDLMLGSKISVHSFAPLIGAAILEIATEGSVSRVCFEER